MAKALGKTEDAAWLTRLANERRAFFRKTFVDEATGKTICSWYDAERKGQLIDTQTSYALPLAFHVVDGDLQKKMALISLQPSRLRWPVILLIRS